MIASIEAPEGSPMMTAFTFHPFVKTQNDPQLEEAGIRMVQTLKLTVVTRV
jgi:hypothetical protein